MYVAVEMKKIAIVRTQTISRVTPNMQSQKIPTNHVLIPVLRTLMLYLKTTLLLVTTMTTTRKRH